MWQAHFALVFVQVAYGGLHVIIKSSLSSPDKNLSFCAWSDFIALLVLAPCAYFYEKKLRPKLTLNSIYYFVLLGLTGIVGNQLLFMFGLIYTSPVIASSLQPSTPVLTFIFSIIFGLETLNLRNIRGILKLFGVCFCVTGAFVIITFQNHSLNSPVEELTDLSFQGHGGPHSTKNESTVMVNSRRLLLQSQASLDRNVISVFGMVEFEKWYFGILCLLGHCASMAAYLILQAQFLKQYPAPISVTAISYFFGDIFFFFFGIFFISPSSWVLNTREIMAVLYASLIASALNYSLMTWTNKMVGPSMVALYTPLQPFTSSILSFLFLGSEISMGSVLGGVLILCGLYLVTTVQPLHNKNIIHVENIK